MRVLHCQPCDALKKQTRNCCCCCCWWRRRLSGFRNTNECFSSPGHWKDTENLKCFGRTPRDVNRHTVCRVSLTGSSRRATNRPQLGDNLPQFTWRWCTSLLMLMRNFQSSHKEIFFPFPWSTFWLKQVHILHLIQFKWTSLLTSDKRLNATS